MIALLEMNAKVCAAIVNPHDDDDDGDCGSDEGGNVISSGGYF